MDATLRELTDLVKEVQPAARRANARLDFALVYPDRKGRNVMRQVGTVFSSRDSEDDFKTLRQLNFQVCPHGMLQALTSPGKPANRTRPRKVDELGTRVQIANIA